MSNSRRVNKAMRKMRGKLPVHGLMIQIPRELGIRSNTVDAGIQVITEQILAGASNKQCKRITHHHDPVSSVDRTLEKSLASIATNAWRAKGKMVDENTGEAKEEMKRVYRHIESIFEALRQIDVVTIDQIGRVYDSGMALKVVSFEPTLGISKEEIKETIRPTIIWKDRLIQMGEVIIGTPSSTPVTKQELP